MRAFSKSLGAVTLLFSITVVGTLPSAVVLAEETPVVESDVVTVDIVGISFSPQILTMKTGQTVRWVNTTKLVHTVTSDATLARDPANAFVPEGATAWHSGNLAAGESFSIQLTVPGEYKYFCKPHELMGHVGTIIVE
jgi:plastocyanin